MNGFCQVETYWMDTTAFETTDYSLFFTNRPLKNTNDSTVNFVNKYSGKTDNIFFAAYDYQTNEIILKYQAYKTGKNKSYPKGKVSNNIFFRINNEFRGNKHINELNIVMSGYGHTFKSQLEYMKQLKITYGDTLSDQSAFLFYAWGDEWRISHYDKGKQSAKKAADDFAIIQHMLDEFVTDTLFSEKYPRDFEINLICGSMGNMLFYKYMQERRKQGIELVQTYDWIVLVGADVPDNSFDENKGFNDLNQIADSVLLLVNNKDVPLGLSSELNLHNRLGLVGPSNTDSLPGYIVIQNITKYLTKEDMNRLGHDYFMVNPFVREELIKSTIEKDNPEEK